MFDNSDSKMHNNIMDNSHLLCATQDQNLDPGLGENTTKGGEGSDTYVIHPNYCAKNTIQNYAKSGHLDLDLDILLFSVTFSSITTTFDGNNVFLVSSRPGCNVTVVLADYKFSRSQHLLIKTVDDQTGTLCACTCCEQSLLFKSDSLLT